MSKHNEVETVESLKGKPPVVVDFEADILANENSGEEGAEVAPAPTGVDPTAAAMLRVAESMEKIVGRQEASRQLTYAEILPVSPWNPEGKKVRLALRRNTFLQGIAVNPMTHTEEEIGLFNKLKPGRYLDRKVEVQVGTSGEVNLQWAGKKQDERIQMYSNYPTLVALLSAVIAEREAKEQRKRNGEFDEDEYL